MDRGAWRATVHGVAKELDKTQRLNINNKHFFYERSSLKARHHQSLRHAVGSSGVGAPEDTPFG